MVMIHVPGTSKRNSLLLDGGPTHAVNKSSISATESWISPRLLACGTVTVALGADCGVSIIGFVVKPGALSYSAVSPERPDPELVDVAGPVRLISTSGRPTSAAVTVW